MNHCIFHDTGPAMRERRLFEIVELAYNARQKVIIFAQSGDRAVAIDRTLWIMKQEAFIPHKIFDIDDVDCAVPVGIVTTELNPLDAKILVADAHCGINFAMGFDTVHEFVDRSSPEIQERCRERFRTYKDRKIQVEYRK
jgi:DNA polymerase IIIc chi subunit